MVRVNQIISQVLASNNVFVVFVADVSGVVMHSRKMGGLTIAPTPCL